MASMRALTKMVEYLDKILLEAEATRRTLEGSHGMRGLKKVCNTLDIDQETEG